MGCAPSRWRARLPFRRVSKRQMGPIVKISIQLLSSAPTRANLGGPEWMDIVSRAERSGGRMILDVLVLSGPDKGKYWAIPLRTNESTVDAGLQQLADKLPSNRDIWDMASITDIIAPLVDFHREDPDFLEIH
ncbi:hypothetical protein B0H11DRAFT_1913078 [Mycena galericulata]|nr:hypothetical protein B0H11DRAFT_1913078 [Mycena galericulata]